MITLSPCKVSFLQNELSLGVVRLELCMPGLEVPFCELTNASNQTLDAEVFLFRSNNMSCTLSTGHFPAISDDLVNSYHLLLCCLDLLYSNALFTRNRRELLNPNFEGDFLITQV